MAVPRHDDELDDDLDDDNGEDHAEFVRDAMDDALAFQQDFYHLQGDFGDDAYSDEPEY